MPVHAQPPAFSPEEKSSLRNMLQRLGRPPLGATGETAGGETLDAGTEPRFSAGQARVLAEELLESVGYSLDQDGHDFLLDLLGTLPSRPGGALEIVGACRQQLMRTLDKHAASDDRHRSQARMLRRVVMLAAALHQAPDLKPWCDIKALAAEKERLEAIPPKERTDAEREYLRFLDKVEESGLLRRHCAMPDPAALMSLEVRFPNFEAPLRFLAEQAAFARMRGDASLHLIPILLVGAAGIGKTHFAMALAEVFGAHTEVISMASQSCGFAIAGMDRGWSSARPGLVFNALQHGETLSPVVVLDEIDKANQDARSDPLGPLYTLLEQRSSRAFRDEFAGFPVNASQVLWLATANDVTGIPAPLLSRFRLFEIAEPTSEQLSSIAGNLYKELAEGIPGVPKRLPRNWLGELSGHSVRDIRISLQQALGKAALRAVMSGNATVTLKEHDFTPAARVQRQRLGFY